MPGKKVLVTRPLAQGRMLCVAIDQAGGVAVHFPSVEIQPVEDKTEVLTKLTEIAEGDWVIFVSANAAEYAGCCLEGGLRRALQSTKVASVGKATKKALEKQGIKVDLSPQQQFDSEALLAMPELNNVKGKQILIVRGNGGRQLLGNTLIKREAKVAYIEVYRRLRPKTSVQPLIRLWKTEGIDVVTVTSCEILDNLRTMLGSVGVSLLQKTPLVVVSKRIAERARSYGVKEVRVANTVSDAAIIDAAADLLSVD